MNIEYYKPNYLILILQILIAYFFTTVFINYFFCICNDWLNFIIIALFIGWLIFYLKKENIYELIFDDYNLILRVKKNFFTNQFHSYDYNDLFYKIKDYQLGRTNATDTLLVYNDNEIVFELREKILSGWKEKDVKSVIEKIIEIGIPKKQD